MSISRLVRIRPGRGLQGVLAGDGSGRRQPGQPDRQRAGAVRHRLPSILHQQHDTAPSPGHLGIPATVLRSMPPPVAAVQCRSDVLANGEYYTGVATIPSGTIDVDEAFLPQFSVNYRISKANEAFFDFSKNARTFDESGFGQASPWGRHHPGPVQHREEQPRARDRLRLRAGLPLHVRRWRSCC